MNTNTKGQQMKTIEETAKEVLKQARAKDSDIELIEAGVIAGLRMAADACEEKSVEFRTRFITTGDENIDYQSIGATECVYAITDLIPPPPKARRKAKPNENLHRKTMA